MSCEATEWSSVLSYLDNCLKTDDISWKTYSLGVRIAALLEPYINLPSICSGPEDHDNVLFFSWDSAGAREHHLEIEIQPDGLLEVFYRNRLTDETYFNEFYKVENLMSDEVMNYVNRLKRSEAT